MWKGKEPVAMLSAALILQTRKLRKDWRWLRLNLQKGHLFSPVRHLDMMPGSFAAETRTWVLRKWVETNAKITSLHYTIKNIGGLWTGRIGIFHSQNIDPCTMTLWGISGTPTWTGICPKCNSHPSGQASKIRRSMLHNWLQDLPATNS